MTRSMPTPLNVMEIEVCKRYATGTSSYSLSKMYGVDSSTILRILQKHNIQRRTHSEASRVYTINHAHFDVIDTPPKAYWLGFIMAEKYIQPKGGGHSAQLSLTLALRDKEHLHKMLAELGSTHPVEVYTNREHPTCRIQIRSNSLVSALRKQGVPYPGGIARFPPIDPGLYNHFIRGVWDGDGCLSKGKDGDWRWVVCGHLSLLSRIQNALMKTCYVGRTRIIHATAATYMLKYGGNVQVPYIVDWLYRNVDASMLLDRNWIRVDDMYKDLVARGVGPHTELLRVMRGRIAGRMPGAWRLRAP